MIPEDFLKRVALTLEMSMRMVKDWLLEIRPENLQQKEKIEKHIESINELLVEISEFTKQAHSEYELNKQEDKAIKIIEDVKDLSDDIKSGD